MMQKNIRTLTNTKNYSYSIQTNAMWKRTFSVTFLFSKADLSICWRMLTARTEIPCMSDCDIKVNIYTLCKHVFAEQERDHRGAATAEITFDIREIKRTGGILVQWTNWQHQQKEEKITSCQSENVLGFWIKNCPPKVTQKMFWSCCFWFF